MRHRREIDGLRAVAVLPVILSHAGFRGMTGGYVGVDVFFVISGYLITAILLSELDRGVFSIARFYERRARRILPALFVVIAACLPFAWAWMMPTQLVNFGQSVVAVALFVSNMLFWLEENYFTASSELKPLLHTWSLAVEEQYYLLFPLFLMLVWRGGRAHVLAGIATLGVASFALSVAMTGPFPSANFFLAPTRAWELMAGAVCAFTAAGRPQRWGNAASLAGLALIGFAAVAYDQDTPFPGVAALAPVLGAALVIQFASPGTIAARFLSTRPMVGIGLISYSAYLWHQPVFAFARLRSPVDPGFAQMTVLVVLTLLLAWATWAWVEQPFRHPPASPLRTRRGVFAASGSAAAVLCAVGLGGVAFGGFPGRFGPEVLRYAEAEGQHPSTECHFDENRPFTAHPVPQCRHPNAAGEVTVMLLGDSHSLAMSDAMAEGLRAAGVGYYEVSHGACVPLPGFSKVRSDGDRTCSDFNEAAQRYAAAAGIRTLVLTGRFPLYLRGNRYNNGEGGREHGIDGGVDLLDMAPAADERTRERRVLAAFETRIRDLARRFDVVLVYPIPEAGWDVPGHAFRLAALDGPQPVLGTPYWRYRERTAEVRDLFNRLAAELPRIHPARVQRVLCSDTARMCLNADRTGAYYSDDDHLSAAGARLVAPVVVNAILQAERGHH